MKKSVASIVVVALLSNCAHTLPYYRDYKKTRLVTISARVGETIDPEEQEQYDLFPEIEGFKAAMFYRIAEGGYEVEILTENKKFAAVNRDPLAITILSDYINRSEEIQDSKAVFEEKWKIVDYDNLGQPITEHEINQTRSRRFGCLGGTKGGITGGLVGCLGGGLILLITMPILANNDVISDEAAEGGFFYGTAICALTGALAGAWLGKITSKDALKAIKESRKPRAVD